MNIQASMQESKGASGEDSAIQSGAASEAGECTTAENVKLNGAPGRTMLGKYGSVSPMNGFLEIALDCVKRGWHVLPLGKTSKFPKIKKADGGQGYKDATSDEVQVRAWWDRWPNSNIGIACGASELVVVDTDHGNKTEEEARAWIARVGLPETYTIHTGRRTDPDTGEPEFGVQLYYRGSLPGCSFNEGGAKGEIRATGNYVLAAGSIHPVSKEPYEVLINAPLAPVPDLVKEWVAKSKTTKPDYGAAEPVDDETADEWKTWLLEYADHYKLEMRDWEKRAANGWWLGIVCPWVHSSGIGVASSTALGILDGRIAFKCAHGTCDGRTTVDFKQELARKHGEYKREPGAWPEAYFGGGKLDEPVEFEEAPDTTRPAYPDYVWKDTIYGEFADYCTAGNYIPKRFFSESLRTVVGAAVGAQLSTNKQGVHPRLFTILIAPPGGGKGTAITAARDFLEGEFGSQTRSTESPLLWTNPRDRDNWCWPARQIGAQIVNPASAPGLIVATLPRKLAKGETRNVLEEWKPLPRFITLQEEIGGLFANFANENSGRGLETAILELYDRASFSTTVTNERAAASGELLYSILGGIPQPEWERIFARSSSVGSGLFSRLNIIGTENDRTVAELSVYDFDEMRRRFLPRISALERTPLHIPLSVDGKALLDEWFTRASAELADAGVPPARLNLHALRVALHLAWLHGHATIHDSDVAAGIEVANFQARMREFYLPAEGNSQDAEMQAKMIKVMKLKRSISCRNLHRDCHGDRAGTAVWDRAFSGLVKSGRIAVVNERNQAGRSVKVVKLLKQKD